MSMSCVTRINKNRYVLSGRKGKLNLFGVFRLQWTLNKFGFSRRQHLIDFLGKKCHTAKFRGIQSSNIATFGNKISQMN